MPASRGYACCMCVCALPLGAAAAAAGFVLLSRDDQVPSLLTPCPVAGQRRGRGGGAEAVRPHFPSAVKPGHPHLRGTGAPFTHVPFSAAVLFSIDLQLPEL